MSQYPPPPGQPQQPIPPMQPAPPPGSVPPGAPMGQQPPPGYTLPPTSRTSGMAIASLICGLLFCIPAITGLLALIFGFAGVKDTSKPNVRGRGMAVVGIILGVLSLIGWGLAGAGMWWGAHKVAGMYKEPHSAATQVVRDLAAGKVDSAAAKTDSESISSDRLTDISNHLQKLGALKDTTIVLTDIHITDAEGEADFRGVAEFAKGNQTLSGHVKRFGKDWKVTELTLPDLQETQPATNP